MLDYQRLFAEEQLQTERERATEIEPNFIPNRSRPRDYQSLGLDYQNRKAAIYFFFACNSKRLMARNITNTLRNAKIHNVHLQELRAS